MKYPGYFIDIMTCILYISDSARCLQTESEEQDIQEPGITFAEVSHTGPAVESGDVDQSLSSSAVSFEDFSNIIEQPSDATTLNEDDITERCVATTTKTTRATTETTTTCLDLVSLPILEPPMASPCSESNPEGNERNEDNRPECEQMEHDSSKPAPSVLLDLDRPSHEFRQTSLSDPSLSDSSQYLAQQGIDAVPLDVKSNRDADLPTKKQKKRGNHSSKSQILVPGADASIIVVEGIHKCSKCPYQSASRYCARQHIQVNHMDVNKRPFACKICPVRCVLSSQLERHIKIVHTNAKPYHCPHCPASWWSACDLRKHMVVHTGERPHHCPHCPQKFKRKDVMNTHIIRSHSSKSL